MNDWEDVLIQSMIGEYKAPEGMIMQDFSSEEQKYYEEALDDIYKPTGINIMELEDE